tara:strand:+ start:437 stop:1744 length:1308 start_codon:yes stop_codon:yes gene_type:complete
MKKIKTLYVSTTEKEFSRKFKKRLRINESINTQVEKKVLKIINDIKKQGNKSLLKFIKNFDKISIKGANKIKISKNEIKKSYTLVSKMEITSLKKAISRIRKFSKRQLSSSWSYNEQGSLLGEKVTAIESVGIYVPGGKASYPSTVLMNVIPAKIAGVEKIIMCSPIERVDNHALAIVAADLCGVDDIYKMGGAHAIAAMAYGTETISGVDKIVGPGNIYVSTAKKIVFGDVGIDNIAGPSEVVIIADQTNNPDVVAMDLFSQAEHDELAQPILISKSARALDMIMTSMNRLINDMTREDIIRKSFSNRGMLIKTRSDSETASLINKIAPEHLEIMSKTASKILNKVRNAGAIFLGENSPEVFGDYCAGPNHVLPTSGSARFSSPLGVYDFQKRSSLIKLSKKLAHQLSNIAFSIATAEGLDAHAKSAKYRDESN